eukprot:TRINITY_DN969_c0_g1_i4.p1 TRINITY_DN969_c0_g1~~TRINITY_DN969_c0_g1_i4.p1  ORF type:complete len:675 (-),score=88.51 TRINITY_DN969_c0_g1_i4:108-2132(-)
MSTAGVLVVEIIALCIIVFLILRKFISFKRTVWYAIATTWIGWVLCFAIVLMLPLDITNTDHQICLDANNQSEELCHEPATYVSPSAMVVQWKLLYWGTFVLSWVVFPILQSYWLAGDFTRGERMIRSLKENVILYIVMAVAGVVFILGLLIAKQLQKEQLMSLIMALANAYGLVLVVVLMGYGLVDIPRYLFKMGSRDSMMQFFQLKAVEYKDGLNKAQEDLTTVLKQVRLIDNKVREHDPYRIYVDKIVNKCPTEYESITEGDGDGELSYANLSNLHAKVKDLRHSAQRALILYEMLLKRAHEEEDIIASYNAPDRVIHWSFKRPRTYRYATLVNKLEWVWLVYLYPWAFRLLGLASAILSVMIVWCEITLPAHESLSPFASIITKSHMKGFGKQLFVFIPLAYMTLCSYTTLFKIRIFNYYRLVPHHMSDANSIMFSANYLCRLAAPLAYNFLAIISQGSAQSSFRKVMGEMDSFPFLSAFRTGFPILVIVVCLMAIFKVFTRMAACCCIKSLRYTIDESPNAIEMGIQILRESRQEKMAGAKNTNKSIKESIYARFSKLRGKPRDIEAQYNNDHAKDGATLKPINKDTPVNTSKSINNSAPPPLSTSSSGKTPARSTAILSTPTVLTSSGRVDTASMAAKYGITKKGFGLFGKNNNNDSGDVELLPRDNV